jgi:citrate lyase beta subunit
MEFSLITVDPVMAVAAEKAGIQRMMIDLEQLGKAIRQKGKGLFLSNHRLEDIEKVKSSISQASVVVRINAIHENTAWEIEQVIQGGADYLMLPYFQTLDQVRIFHDQVAGRVKTILLLETDGAVHHLDAILAHSPPDEFHIGLNDLSICLNKSSIFELFLDGTVASIASRLQQAGFPFGVAGVGALSQRGLPISPLLFFREQIRLGATRGWLGRSFRAQLSPAQLALEFRALREIYLRWDSEDPIQMECCHQALFAAMRHYCSAEAGRTF